MGLDALEPEFGPAHVFRPYRDVRFSRDKSPYKTAVGAVADGGRYVQLSAQGLLVAAGYHQTASDQVERLRRAVADDRSGPELQRLLRRLTDGGYRTWGDRLKTRPRGYPADTRASTCSATARSPRAGSGCPGRGCTPTGAWSGSRGPGGTWARCRRGWSGTSGRAGCPPTGAPDRAIEDPPGMPYGSPTGTRARGTTSSARRGPGMPGRNSSASPTTTASAR